MGVRYVPAAVLRRLEVDASAALDRWAVRLRSVGRAADDEDRRNQLRHMAAELRALLQRTVDVLDGFDARDVAELLGEEEPSHADRP